MAVSTLPSQPTELVMSSAGGENAYAIRVSGDLLSPDVADGQLSVFDPDAGLGQAGEVVAVWFNGHQTPAVVRLALAVPPFGPSDSDDFMPVLAVHTDRGRRMVGMDRVMRVDRLVGFGEAHAEVSHV